MNEIVIYNLTLIFTIVMIIVNYIVTAIAMMKIAKKENNDKPWLAWIPVCSDYLLIKLGQGSLWFMILAILSLVTGGSVATLNQGYLTNVSLVLTTLWVAYKIVLYYRICDRYEMNILIFVVGFIAQLIGSLVIIGIIISIIAHIILVRRINKVKESKIVVESKIILPKRKK
ncbi:MAG: hypothetical protein E7214_00065 [Clostridium sp.]|nr:hypothetical protein [Clostridium sp.]